MGVFNSLFKSKIQKLIEKAEKGDAISLYQLGMCYFDGTEVTKITTKQSNGSAKQRNKKK